jgi:phage protein D
MPAAAAEALVAGAEVLINGSPLDAPTMSELIELSVDQAVAATNRAMLRFSDEEFKLIDSSKFELAKEVVVKFKVGNGAATTVFTGEITSVGSEQAFNERHEVVVEAFDKTHRLAREAVPKTFLQMSYGDIVSQIVGTCGLSASTGGAAMNRVHPYVLKTGTNFEFFDEIALRTGSSWYVDVDGELQFLERASGAAAATLTFGGDLNKFKARFSDNGHPKSVEVRSWDYATKKAIVGTDSSQLTSPTGGSVIGLQNGARTKFNASAGKVVSTTTGAATQDEAMDLAKSLARRQALDEVTARGQCLGSPKVAAGSLVEIKNVGTKMSGKYYLTNVEHSFGRGSYTTRFTAGGLQTNTMVDLLRAEPTTATTPFSRSHMVIGVVTNNKDVDQDIGRVKVKFPSLSDEEESAWARIVSPGAGSGRGMHFVPNIDDEVLVAFEQGDLRRPIVIGGLWNGSNKPWGNNASAIDSSGKSVQWGIKSRTGHQILVNEDSGDDKNSVKVLLQDGTLLHVGQDKIELIHKTGKPIEVKTGSADIVMKDDNITIKGKDITIEATGNLTLKATGNIEAKATGGAKVEANSSVEVKGTGGVKVTSAAMLELKGSLTKIN